MLPKIDVPIYELTLPLLKKKIKIRPFLVKEEKILLMAMEAKDEESILLAIKQIVNNCSVDEIDVDELPLTDLEYLFLQLRARSIGENVELKYQCNNVVGDNDDRCGNLVKLEFNVLEIEPTFDENHQKKIQLTSNLGVMMRYPDFKIIEKVKGLNESEVIMKTLINCIDYIYDNENVYYTKDVPEKEVEEFVDSLTKEQFEKIQQFFETLPKLIKNVNFKCSKCEYEEEIVLEGIQSFFV